MQTKTLKNVRKVAKFYTATKATNEKFNEEIKYFFENNYDLENKELIVNFFNRLHKIDYKYKFDKTFYIKLYDFNKNSAGAFAREDETQYIIFNTVWNSNAPSKFKKGILINTYFHENSHERQYDSYVFYRTHKNVKCEAFQKILNFEFSSDVIPQYNFQLKEIDARMQSAHRFCELIKNGIVAYNTALVFEPVDGMIKNISVLTDTQQKENYFNNIQNFDIRDNVKDYATLDEIKFDADGYMKVYENFLNNDKNFEYASIELIEAQEVFKDPKQRYKLKKALEEQFEAYKQDITFLYKFIQRYYIPHKSLVGHLVQNAQTQEELYFAKKNNQMCTLKILQQEYFNFCIDEKYTESEK